MSIFSRSHRQKLVEIYKSIQSHEDRIAKYSWGSDIDQILTDYPKLELQEAVLLGAYLERSKEPREFDDALRKLGVR